MQGNCNTEPFSISRAPAQAVGQNNFGANIGLRANLNKTDLEPADLEENIAALGARLDREEALCRPSPATPTPS